MQSEIGREGLSVWIICVPVDEFAIILSGKGTSKVAWHVLHPLCLLLIHKDFVAGVVFLIVSCCVNFIFSDFHSLSFAIEHRHASFLCQCFSIWQSLSWRYMLIEQGVIDLLEMIDSSLEEVISCVHHWSLSAERFRSFNFYRLIQECAL